MVARQRAFLGQESNANIPGYLGSSSTEGIGTDGMLTGPNFAAQEAMLDAVGCRIIASGGVSRREDVAQLADLKKRHPRLDGVIVGKALYERRVELADLLAIAGA